MFKPTKAFKSLAFYGFAFTCKQTFNCKVNY